MRNKLMSSASIAAIAIATGLGAAALSPTAEAAQWGGFQIGAHVGAGQANWNASWRSSAGATPTIFDNLNTDGILAGIHGGYSWQFGQAVFGVEGDWSFMDWEDDVSSPYFTSSSLEVASAHAEVDSLASVRAKIGIVVGADQSVLLFVNGGAAWANADALVCITASCSNRANFSFDDVGAVVGGGFEYAMTNEFRLRVDGSYYWFDDNKNRAFGGASSTSTRFELEDAYTFRVGGTWYLGG